MPPRYEPPATYVDPLHELVVTTMLAKGLVSEDVSVRSGRLVSRPLVDWLRRGRETVTLPQNKTIEGLARGLGLPISRVHQAALDSLPRQPAHATSADTRAVVALMESATAGQRKRWRRLLEAQAASEGALHSTG